MPQEIEIQKSRERLDRRPQLTDIQLPDYRIGNDELAKYLSDLGVKTGTSKEITAQRISETTGIDVHYYLQELGQKPEEIQNSVPNIAIKAAVSTIEKRGWDPQTINEIVFCTSYPFGEKVSEKIADLIGASNTQTQDVYTACSGSVHAIKYLHDRYRGSHDAQGQRFLIVAAEHYSARMADDLNRSIFSDGAAAFAFENKTDFEILDIMHKYEPNPAIQMPIDELQVPLGAIYLPIPQSEKYFQMDGKNVYIWAAKSTPSEMIQVAYKKALPAIEIGQEIFIVTHQGSGRMNAGLKDSLSSAGVKGLISSQSVRTIGNLASASVLAELHYLFANGIGQHHENKRVEKGDIVILAGFGAGLSTTVATLRANISVH